ncbi:hypothetical protein PXD04_10330 [Methanosphaera sp. ISO3-F5]|uniref:hypothetical protein n=1 Tax=Methanosphaera sp. ISO3-F5 TaxID=1452353 RepID=UPI002B25AB1A|nr:hypothetical protein [Methanosphaera sp. ISO3-F5]WQH64087.1 hypothetical protein PXD04_10330 [Methanosphaera sp. ISO3-F5]
MNLEEYNNKFYEDTYYDLDVRLFLKAYSSVQIVKGTNITDQVTITDDDCKNDNGLNEYEKLYLHIIKILDTYCEHFVIKPVVRKHNVGLPVFLQLKKEYQEKNKGINMILDNIHHPDYILLDLIYKEDGSYPEELIPPCNTQYLYKEINNFYEQEIFDTDSKYFDETGQVLNQVEYAKNHIQLLRDDYE